MYEQALNQRLSTLLQQQVSERLRWSQQTNTLQQRLRAKLTSPQVLVCSALFGVLLTWPPSDAAKAASKTGRWQQAWHQLLTIAVALAH